MADEAGSPALEEQAEVAVHDVDQSIEEPVTAAEIIPVTTTSNREPSSVQNESDDSSRKLFVGALSRDTTEDGLREYFSSYGEILDCIVKVDPETKRPRGFGFITFSDPSSIDKIAAAGPHILDGRTIDPKLAVPFSSQQPQIPRVRKIFLGGLPAELPEEDLREYFGKYGTVDLVELPCDRESKQRRGFGFVSFEDMETVEEVVKQNYHTIGEYTVEVKRATPRDQQNRQQAAGGRGGATGGFPQRGGPMAGGRGRGGGGVPPRGGAWGGAGAYAGYGAYNQYNAAAYQAAYQAYSGYGGYGAYAGYGGYGAYGGYPYDYSQQYNVGGDSYSRYGAMRNNPYSQQGYRPY